MNTFIVRCPFCSKDLTIQAEYANQQMACPFCQNIFTAPAAPVAPQPDAASTPPKRQHNLHLPQVEQQVSPGTTAPRIPGRFYHGKSYRQKRSSFSFWSIWSDIKALMGILSVIAFLVFIYFNFISDTYKNSQTIRQIKSEILPGLFANNSTNFYGYRCSFISADLKHEKDNKYSGTVTFMNNAQESTRKVVGYRKDGYISAMILWDYVNNPRELAEDAPIWFYKLYPGMQNEYTITDRKTFKTSGNTVELLITIRKDSSYSDTKYIKIVFTKKSSDDNDYHYSWELLDGY